MGAQFHSRLMFMLLSKFDLKKSLKWCYNEAYHGEEPIDRVVGTVKNLVFRAMKLENTTPKEVRNAANLFIPSISST